MIISAHERIIMHANIRLATIIWVYRTSYLTVVPNQRPTTGESRHCDVSSSMNMTLSVQMNYCVFNTPNELVQYP